MKMTPRTLKTTLILLNLLGFAIFGLGLLMGLAMAADLRYWADNFDLSDIASSAIIGVLAVSLLLMMVPSPLRRRGHAH